MLGFIGTGNMASAIIEGIVSSGTLKGEEIGAYDIDPAKTSRLAERFSLKVFSSAQELASACNKVVLCVKPNSLQTVLRGISSQLKEKDPLIISIAAGKTTDFIESCLDYEGKIARIMPNINAIVSSAVSGYCFNEKVTEEEKSFVSDFCSSFGIGIAIDEGLFPVYSAIGGCSPAFAYMFIDSLARAAVKNGMTKPQALKVAAGAVMGSAKMILESDDHPWELIDKVCSPGGTTIEGVASLQKDGFEAAVISAVEASLNKDKKM